MRNVVELRNIGMKYQSLNGEIPALEKVNLSVREGELENIQIVCKIFIVTKG